MELFVAWDTCFCSWGRFSLLAGDGSATGAKWKGSVLFAAPSHGVHSTGKAQWVSLKLWSWSSWKDMHQVNTLAQENKYAAIRLSIDYAHKDHVKIFSLRVNFQSQSQAEGLSIYASLQVKIFYWFPAFHQVYQVQKVGVSRTRTFWRREQGIWGPGDVQGVVLWLWCSDEHPEALSCTKGGRGGRNTQGEVSFIIATQEKLENAWSLSTMV